mgnify:CR=1 FL=1
MLLDQSTLKCLGTLDREGRGGKRPVHASLLHSSPDTLARCVRLGFAQRCAGELDLYFVTAEGLAALAEHRAERKRAPGKGTR